MEKKINYHLQSLGVIAEVDRQSAKPKLLLHACCAPCSTYTLLFLCPHFEVTIYYSNSNIFPFEEYEKRYNELVRFLEDFRKKEEFIVRLLAPKYDNDQFNIDLEPFADLPEGSKRCLICFEKRMGQAYAFAEENGFDYFTTTMTISRQKDSQIINAIGRKLEAQHSKTKYFFSDFKKDKGIDIARQMRDDYDLYQQTYCGCKYTFLKKK